MESWKVANAAVFLFGGIKTSKEMTSNVLHHLLADPTQLEAVRAQPALVDSAIEVSVGRTGRTTPFAVLEPVFVGGSTVQMATLHNQDQVAAKDVRPGDTVVVRKAGDVIPEVVGPVLSLRPAGLAAWEFPKVCPCPLKTELVRPEGEADTRCVEPSCPFQRVDDKAEITDAIVVAVIEKMLKQRKDSITQYEAAQRQDLADAEKFEAGVLAGYMPQGLSAAEVEAIVAAAVAESGARGPADMGKVIALVKPKVAGRADMGEVSRLVKAKLSAV